MREVSFAREIHSFLIDQFFSSHLKIFVSLFNLPLLRRTLAFTQFIRFGIEQLTLFMDDAIGKNSSPTTKHKIQNTKFSIRLIIIYSEKFNIVPCISIRRYYL